MNETNEIKDLPTNALSTSGQSAPGPKEHGGGVEKGLEAWLLHNEKAYRRTLISMAVVRAVFVCLLSAIAVWVAFVHERAGNDPGHASPAVVLAACALDVIVCFYFAAELHDYLTRQRHLNQTLRPEASKPDERRD